MTSAASAFMGATYTICRANETLQNVHESTADVQRFVVHVCARAGESVQAALAAPWCDLASYGAGLHCAAGGLCGLATACAASEAPSSRTSKLSGKLNAPPRVTRGICLATDLEVGLLNDTVAHVGAHLWRPRQYTNDDDLPTRSRVAELPAACTLRRAGQATSSR